MAASAFLQAKAGLEAHCQAFAQAQLLTFEPKKVYQLADFDSLQEAHQNQVGCLRCTLFFQKILRACIS